MRASSDRQRLEVLVLEFLASQPDGSALWKTLASAFPDAPLASTLDALVDRDQVQRFTGAEFQLLPFGRSRIRNGSECELCDSPKWSGHVCPRRAISDRTPVLAVKG